MLYANVHLSRSVKFYYFYTKISTNIMKETNLHKAFNRNCKIDTLQKD